MGNSKLHYKNTTKCIKRVGISQKHDANLKKDSTLYFQIGLILALLGAYAGFEMQFQTKISRPVLHRDTDIAVIDVAPVFAEEVIQKTTEPQAQQRTVLIDVYKAASNDLETVEATIVHPSTDFDDFIPVTVGEIDVIEPPVDLPPIDFRYIEKVPVYPGCERKKSNKDKRQCMSRKIAKLIHSKFNNRIAAHYGLSGLQNIQTQFTVDKFGRVTHIKVRGPHPALEREAERVIQIIPDMQPGYQHDMPVGVIYNLPIKFMARN